MKDLQPNYPIRDITGWVAVNDEPMGTKPKYWLQTADNERWLFKKKHRPHSDDDWSEKIASELAGLLGIPHATVELACRHGERGIVSRDLVTECGAEELIHGNSLLVEADPNYPSGEYYQVAHHTIERIFTVFVARSIGLPPGVEFVPEVADARDLFVGYLLFDAWIGNTDRHHENWAVLKLVGDHHALSPSYDHAASLGHNVQDGERDERLTTRDKNRQLAAYTAKARSAIFRTEFDKKPVLTDEAFTLAAALRRPAGLYWLDRLGRIVDDDATDIVRRIPCEIMTEPAKRFADLMRRVNRARLLTLTV
jgi:hypothetical protein